jgi:hypothetical protein
MDRDYFQHTLSDSNPQWKEFAESLERNGQKPRTNPDGDVRFDLAFYTIN